MTSVRSTIAFAFLFPLAASASEDLRAVSARVTTAYALADTLALHEMWSPQSAAAERRIVTELVPSRAKCRDLKGVAIDSVTGTEADPVVRTTAVRIEASGVNPKHLILSFHGGGDRWLLTDVNTAERAAARRLVNQPGEWDALVRDDAELLTRDLAIALADIASPGGADANLADARVAADLLHNLASLVDTPLMRSLAMTADAVIADAGGRVPKAMQLSGEAAKLGRESGDADALVRALIVQSREFERSPNGYEKALELSLEALRHADDVESSRLLMYLLGNSGNLYLKTGNYAEALRYIQRSAVLAKEAGDVPTLIRTEAAQGLILQIEGNYDLAIVRQLRAIELTSGDVGNDAFRGQIYIQLSQSYSALGRENAARDALLKAEELGRRSKAPIVIGETHRLLGSSYRRAHDYAAATRELEQALATFESAKRIHFIPGAMSELALTRLEAGDVRDAVLRADRCAEYSRNLDNELPFIECRTFGGEAHRKLGENDVALTEFEEAIEATEGLRRSLVGDARQRAHFLDRVISPYLGAADILAERGDVAASLAMAEQAKSRALLDILAGDSSHVQSVLTPAEEQRNGELTARVATLNRRLRDARGKSQSDQKAVRALQSELDAARAEYESYQLVLDAAHPRRIALEGTIPIAKPESVAPLLGATTAIVEYWVGADSARVYVVTATGVDSVGLPVAKRSLDELVTRYTTALAHGDFAYRDDARALYAMLLQPVETLLRGKKALCIVPDGSLWRLPFESLVDRSGKFVIESRTCFYAPSMSVFALVTRGAAREKAATTLLAVGNPAMGGGTAARLRGVPAALGPLKEAEDEVRALQALYGARRSRIYVGAEATEPNVRKEMASAGVLHFATHAVLDEENPMYSEIVLAESADTSDDGLLAAWEIMRLSLRADIAVLSACETARGRLAAGEGVIGFTWALFAAGCPSSVVSEWKVDSESTKELMVAFHRTLLAAPGGDLAKAQALRAAKLSLLKKAATRHPFYWSPFVLVGAAR